jgi:hypothetical protein
MLKRDNGAGIWGRCPEGGRGCVFIGFGAEVALQVHLRSWQRPQDGSADCFDVVHHIVIPKSQNSVALCAQEARPMFIVPFASEVLAAIQLNNKLGFRSAEVSDIRAYGMLAPESYSVQIGSAEISP